MKKIALIFGLIMFLSVFVQASIANIDDTIKFNLFYDGLIPKIITKADMQLCNNLDCSSVHSTKELFCEGNTCVLFDAHQIFYEWEYRKLYCKGVGGIDQCSPIDYNNPPYQVVMEFSDQTKKSNVFQIPVPTETPDKFDAAFDLKITDSELIVKKEGTFKDNKDSKPSNPTGFDQSIIFILIAIIVVAGAVFYFVKKKK